jgi:hypothetical protein
VAGDSAEIFEFRHHVSREDARPQRITGLEPLRLCDFARSFANMVLSFTQRLLPYSCEAIPFGGASGCGVALVE